MNAPLGSNEEEQAMMRKTPVHSKELERPKLYTSPHQIFPLTQNDDTQKTIHTN